MPLLKLSIRQMSRAKPYKEMGKPGYTEEWEKRLQTKIDWKEIWKTKLCYCNPRDYLTFQKLRHRNLWVAKTNKEGSVKCLWCDEEESMLHLAECTKIKEGFWDYMLQKMGECGQNVENTSAFVVLGHQRNLKNKQEIRSWLAIAWRKLYANIVRARIENEAPNLETARKETLALLQSRISAYGQRWRSLYLRKRYQQENEWEVSNKWNKRSLVVIDRDGKYRIKESLCKIMREELENRVLDNDL